MPLTDQEREELCSKLDKDLDDFIAEAAKKSEKRRKENPEPEQTLDELVAELKDHPAFLTEIDPTKPLPPLIEGLQALKYDSDDVRDNAESYKDDGNHNFKLKKYKWAIDAYTAGIKLKCADRLINAQLYSNRGASQSFIGNWRSAFLDCVVARKFKPDHLKAITKGIQCSMERRRYDDAIRWCDDALLLSPSDKKVLDMRAKSEKLRKQQERDRRREQAKERKQLAEENKLIETIKSRGVKVAGSLSTEDDEDAADAHRHMLSSLESHHPSGARVHIDEKGTVQWPVMLLYPEHTQSDFVEKFADDTCLTDHLEVMFGGDTSPAPWDLDKKYKPQALQVYFEDRKDEKLYPVDVNSPLSSVLQHEKCTVHGGTPSFIVLVKDSDFAVSFLKRYGLL